MLLVGVSGTGIASFLPWARSGDRLRDSYELVAVVGRLELLPSILARPYLAWYFLPLCAIGTAIVVLSHRPLWSTVLGLIVGSAAGGLAAAVVSSPLGVGIGARIAMVTGTLCVAGALMVIAHNVTGTKRDRDQGRTT